ncbi:MAG TPA: TonB-dependent receptor [Steroidobacteraceae bacterium]
MIRRKRNILEMAVATAIFGACATGAISVSHAAQAAGTTDDNSTQPASQTADPARDKSKKQVANEGMLHEVVVTGFISSLQNSIAIQKNSDQIVEAVSSEQIGKLPGTSIADALGRLPGVAVQDVNGRPADVSIHGLGPDFSTTLFNGTLEASTGNNRGVKYDVYPGGWFKAVVVHLTPQADLLGQGLAGTVDLQTIQPLDEHKRNVAINAFYTLLEPNEVMPGQGVSNRGHDINALYTDQFFDHTFGVNLAADFNAWPTHIQHQGPWGYPTDANGNLVVGGSKNYNFSSLMKRNAYLATFQFRPSRAFSSTMDLTYSDTHETQQAKGAEFPLKWSSATLASANPVNGFDQSGTYTGVYPVIRNDYNKYEDYQYNILWRNHFKLSDSWTANLNASYNRAERQDLQLESYSGNGYNGPASNGAVPPNTVDFNEQSGGNGELYLYPQQSLTSGVVLTDPQGWGSGSQLVQAGFINLPHIEDHLANVTASAEHFFGSGPISSVEFGASRTDRRKNFHVDQDFLVLPGAACGYIITSTCTPTQTAPIPAGATEGTIDALGFMGVGPEVLYNPLALIASGALVEYPTFMSSLPIPPNWTVSELDTDAYLQFNIQTNLGESVGLRGNFGVQVAHTSQNSAGARPAAGASTGGSKPTVLIPQFGGTTYTRYLPSLNLVFTFPGDNDLRLGVARTMIRPRMDQLNDSQVVGANITNLLSTDPNTAAFSASGGNPQLLPYMATNYNLSAEHYFNGDATAFNCNENESKASGLCDTGTGYVQLAAYYLRLTDYVNPNEGVLTNFAPFESAYLSPAQIASLGTPEGVSTIPYNNGAGHLEGLQVATNIPLGNFTSWLNGLGILASANRNLSAVYYPGNTTPVTIDGLSKWVQDYTLYFQHGGFQARVSDEYRSSFLGRVYGTSASRVEDYIKGYSQVDAQLSYSFYSGALNGLTLTATGTNLGNHGFYAYQNGDPRQVIVWEHFSRTYQIGFSYNFD